MSEKRPRVVNELVERRRVARDHTILHRSLTGSPMTDAARPDSRLRAIIGLGGEGDG
jgi:hypothetical protein